MPIGEERKPYLDKIKTCLSEDGYLKDEKIDFDVMGEGIRLVEDLSLDSVAQMELIMRLEEIFDISIPDEDLESLKTIGNVIDLIIELKK